MNAPKNKEPPERWLDRAEVIAKAPIAKELTMKSLPRFRRQHHFPDLFDCAASRHSISAPDFRVRWVASRCRVSLATAETIISNAGFSDGERH